MKELYSVCWNITNKCNENCKFCYRKISNDNSLEDNKKIFDNLLNIKINKISFCGGEPFLYDNLLDLVDYVKANQPDMILSLTTNGKLINEDLIDEIIKRFDWITFSIDSSKDLINEEIGRGINHLPKIKYLLDKFNNNIKIKINTVVNKYNLDDLDNIYKIISKYNINRWKLLRFYPNRKGEINKDLFEISDVESKEVENFILGLNNNNIKIQYNNYDEIATSYFSIYPDGSVENKNNEVVGNLLINSIEDILKIKGNELKNHNLRKNYD